jgi:hypothetical protein
LNVILAKKVPSVQTHEVEVKGDPDGSTITALPVPFPVKKVLRKARPAVVVRVERLGKKAGAHEYRSAVCWMSGAWCL